MLIHLMDNSNLIFSFVLLSVLVELTPGPNMVYLVILSLTAGKRVALSAVAGVTLGLLFIGSSAAFGVAALISSSPYIYELLRWGGVAYLLWLAWCGWQEDIETSPSKSGITKEDLRYFRRGVLTNLLNPKAALFYIAILPGFIVTRVDPLYQTLFLTLVNVAIATAIHISIVLLALRLKPLLDKPERRIYIRKGLALLLVVVAAWFAVAAGRG